MKRGKPIQLVLILFVVCMILLNGMFTVSAGHAADKTLLMATTTSTDNTGLLDYLMPSFTAKTGIGIRWVSAGTGKALKLGENCDVDALLAHAPQAEQNFVDKGFGIDRQKIMYNDFVLVGAKNNSDKFIQNNDIIDAFKIIYNNEYKFVSRGDESGTHLKEKSIWEMIKGSS